MWGYAGNDGVDALFAFKPLWGLGGDGDDSFIADIRDTTLYGGAGNDDAVLYGSAQTESLRMWPKKARFMRDTLNLWVYDTEIITADSDGGRDTARLFDSTGTDEFVSDPQSVTMCGSEFSNTANGFRYAYGVGGSGGEDWATLRGSWDSDTFQATPATATLSGVDFYVQVSQFHSVSVDGFPGGRNTATLTGSAGEDCFSTSELGTSLSDMAGTYELVVSQFDIVKAYGVDGADTAYLSDSREDDTLVISPTQAVFKGPTGSWLNTSAFGFETVVASSSDGNADTVTFYDSTGDDKFVVEHGAATMMPKAGGSYSLTAYGFKNVHGLATAGGTDDAYIYGWDGTDTYRADGAQGRMFYADGSFVRARYFDSFYTYSSPAECDLAILNGTAGKDTFYGTPTVSRLYGTGYYHRVVQYGRVEVHGNGGVNTADLTDSSSDDFLEAQGTWTKLSGPETLYSILVDGFNPTKAKSSNVGDKQHVVAGVDFLIATGYWEEV